MISHGAQILPPILWELASIHFINFVIIIGFLLNSSPNYHNITFPTVPERKNTRTAVRVFGCLVAGILDTDDVIVGLHIQKLVDVLLGDQGIAHIAILQDQGHALDAALEGDAEGRHRAIGIGLALENYLCVQEIIEQG